MCSRGAVAAEHPGIGRHRNAVTIRQQFNTNWRSHPTHNQRSHLQKWSELRANGTQQEGTIITHKAAS